MRIIAGKHKGLILKSFDLITTRPTSDLIRGAVFNTIFEKINDSIVLDLFAGTGAIGLEALSRNAKFCYFADSNEQSVKLIKKNAEKFELNSFKILKMEFQDALHYLFKQKIKFDIIFLDPPYQSNLAEESIKKIKKYGLLNQNGIVVWEHSFDKLKYVISNFENAKTKKYGQKYVSYFNI